MMMINIVGTVIILLVCRVIDLERRKSLRSESTGNSEEDVLVAGCHKNL